MASSEYLALLRRIARFAAQESGGRGSLLELYFGFISHSAFMSTDETREALSAWWHSQFCFLLGPPPTAPPAASGAERTLVRALENSALEGEEGDRFCDAVVAFAAAGSEEERNLAVWSALAETPLLAKHCYSRAEFLTFMSEDYSWYVSPAQLGYFARVARELEGSDIDPGEWVRLELRAPPCSYGHCVRLLRAALRERHTRAGVLEAFDRLAADDSELELEPDEE